MEEQKISEKLYELNAWISGRFLTGFKKPTVEDMTQINQHLGQIIKELREIEK